MKRTLILAVLAAHAVAGDAREEAWAAFKAGNSNDPAVVPGLFEALKHGDPAARLWVLDALVRLDADVPGDDLAQFYRHHPDEVLVLLARHPAKKEDALLAVAERCRSHDHWVAACNLLLAQRSKQLAPHLLADLQLTLEVDVTDEGEMPAIGLGGGAGGAFGGRARHPADWPPRPVYQVLHGQEEGAVVLAAGRKTIYWKRTEIPPGGPLRRRTSHTVGGGTRNRMRVEYIADLLEIPPDKLGLRETTWVIVEWKGAADYQREVAAGRERVRAAYAAVLERLVAKELLDADDVRRFPPKIRIQVDDSRSDRSEPLPQVGNGPAGAPAGPERE